MKPAGVVRFRKIFLQFSEVRWYCVSIFYVVTRVSGVLSQILSTTCINKYK